MSEEKAYEEPESTLLLYSGLEDAFIGTVETYGRPPVACYSKKITLSLLQSNFELTEEEARDKYEYEYLQSNFDVATPVFLDDEPPPIIS
tara:strand:- start:2234 stop:2503 length:270 start_codon:yes stop_codon:yes gene_type:complete